MGGGGIRAVTRRDNWGEGGAYSYIRVLPDGFLLKAIVFTVCEHEYTPPQLSRLVTDSLTALGGMGDFCKFSYFPPGPHP
jgi:hypothetical protein